MSDTTIDPNATVVAVEAPAAPPAPRGLAAVVADLESAVSKLTGFAAERSILDAAEAEVRTMLSSIKAEYETEKAKIEAFF